MNDFHLEGEYKTIWLDKLIGPSITIVIVLSWYFALIKYEKYGLEAIALSIFITVGSIFAYWTMKKDDYKNVLFQKDSIEVRYRYKPALKVCFKDIIKVISVNEGGVKIYFSKNGSSDFFFMYDLVEKADRQFLEYLRKNGISFYD